LEMEVGSVLIKDNAIEICVTFDTFESLNQRCADS